MAVLAVIGGVDSRPRLGGTVEHKEWSVGTVCRIAPNGKVTLQCEGQKGPKICPISQVKPVSNIVIIIIIVIIIVIIITNIDKNMMKSHHQG